MYAVLVGLASFAYLLYARPTGTQLVYNMRLYQSPFYTGGVDGQAFMIDGCSAGSTMRALDLCVESGGLRGIRFILTNGNSTSLGKTTCSAPERLALTQGEKIVNLTLASNDRGTRVCGLDLTTSKATRFFVTGKGCRSAARVLRVAVGSGTLCGAFGRASADQLFALGFFFLPRLASFTGQVSNVRYAPLVALSNMPDGGAASTTPLVNQSFIQTLRVSSPATENTWGSEAQVFDATIGNVWLNQQQLADFATWDSQGILDHVPNYVVQQPPSLNVSLLCASASGPCTAQGNVVQGLRGPFVGPQRAIPWVGEEPTEPCPAGCSCKVDYFVAQGLLRGYFTAQLSLSIPVPSSNQTASIQLPIDGIFASSTVATRAVAARNCSTGGAASLEGGSLQATSSHCCGTVAACDGQNEAGTCQTASQAGSRHLSAVGSTGPPVIVLSTQPIGNWWTALNTSTGSANTSPPLSGSEGRTCPLLVYQFVCGEDGRTYDSQCMLDSQGVAKAADGPCASFLPPASEDGQTTVILIILGVTLGVVVLLVLGFCCWRARRSDGTAFACVTGVQLCANPTYNPYQLHDGPGPRGPSRKPTDMESLVNAQDFSNGQRTRNPSAIATGTGQGLTGTPYDTVFLGQASGTEQGLGNPSQPSQGPKTASSAPWTTRRSSKFRDVHGVGQGDPAGALGFPSAGTLFPTNPRRPSVYRDEQLSAVRRRTSSRSSEEVGTGNALA